MNFLDSSTRRGRLVAINFLALVAVTLVSAVLAPRPVVPLGTLLYEGCFSRTDEQAITRLLAANGISHRLERGTVLLEKSADMWRARALLVDEALPVQRSSDLYRTREEFPPGPSKIDMAMEQRATRQSQIEAECTMTLRELEGVRDAQVKLAIPKKTYLGRHEGPRSARILLLLKDDHTPSRQQVLGIVSMICETDRGLAAENVTVIDTVGRHLTDRETAWSSSKSSSRSLEKKGPAVYATDCDFPGSDYDALEPTRGFSGAKWNRP